MVSDCDKFLTLAGVPNQQHATRLGTSGRHFAHIATIERAGERSVCALFQSRCMMEDAVPVSSDPGVQKITGSRHSSSKAATAAGLVTLSLFLGWVGCDDARKTPPGEVGSRYLYIWIGDKDENDDDFIAVVDVREGSPAFGKVLTTQP